MKAYIMTVPKVQLQYRLGEIVLTVGMKSCDRQGSFKPNLNNVAQWQNTPRNDLSAVLHPKLAFKGLILLSCLKIAKPAFP